MLATNGLVCIPSRAAAARVDPLLLREVLGSRSGAAVWEDALLAPDVMRCMLQVLLMPLRLLRRSLLQDWVMMGVMMTSKLPAGSS